MSTTQQSASAPLEARPDGLGPWSDAGFERQRGGRLAAGRLERRRASPARLAGGQPWRQRRRCSTRVQRRRLLRRRSSRHTGRTARSATSRPGRRAILAPAEHGGAAASARPADGRQRQTSDRRCRASEQHRPARIASASASSVAVAAHGTGEDLGAVVGDGDGVLGVGGEAAVGGDHGPLVVEELGAGAAEADHRLDGVGLARARACGPCPGWPQLGTSGCSCMAMPMPWPVYSFTTEKPAASATPCTAAPMSESRPPGCMASIAGREGRLGDVDQPLRLGVDLPHPGGEGGVAVPALDDRAAVDGDEVALLEPVRARGCRGRSRRSATRRSPPGTAGGCSRGSSTGRPRRSMTSRPIRSSSSGGDPRPDRLADAGVHLRHHPPGLAHLGQVVLRPLHAAQATGPRVRCGVRVDRLR